MGCGERAGAGGFDCENNLPVLKRVKGKEIREPKNNGQEDNILIEGDNYHALTVLNYTHQGKIDVIYIDPPYNTGNQDFKYNDKFVDKEDGFRHSKWLNFMEKRLNLAKDLLKDTGVIFISIDENEFAQLKLLCDKIFGEDNFIECIVWNKKSSAKGVPPKTMIVGIHEYIIAYRKTDKFSFLGIKRDISTFSNPDNDNRGIWRNTNIKSTISTNSFEIIDPETGNKFKDTWALSPDTLNEMIANKQIIFPKNKNGQVRAKEYFFEFKNENTPIISNWGLFDSQSNTEMITSIFEKEKVFSNPKPIKLMEFLLKVVLKNDSTVLDFMAGSGTTGQAVLGLNKEDGGNRKFILCTNNELNGFEKELREKGLSEKEIEKYGICQRVTYPRLEKVIKGYKKNGNGEKVEGLGGNLQYFRTDFVRKNNNKAQVRLNLTGKCTEMLCVKENIFNIETENDNYKIFSSNTKDKFLCVYYNFAEDGTAEFVGKIKKIKGRKVIYMFSVDNEVDKNIFAGVDDFTVEAIPEGILKEYEKLNKINIPVNKELIYFDFNKAKKVIFEEGAKNEGAVLLRIVLEKTIQKIAQKNGVGILKSDGKGEKISLLNDKLKSDGAFSKVEWEENKTYLAIGNHAAHGEYGEYELGQVKNFHRHIQALLNKFGI